MTDISLIVAAIDTVGTARGRVAAPRLTDNRVSLVIDVSGLAADAQSALQADVENAVMRVPGVEAVRVALTAERSTRRLIAVASGKGGVGKSTLSANLAVALSRMGLRVGLIDADIYGPSQPKLMGTEGMKPTARDQQLTPVPTRYGVPMLSIGHLVKPTQAIAWRGPMSGKALNQLIDADWGDVQILIVDLPPGTGDVQLSMIAKHKPAGAVIVSTPQDLALIDAARAIDLFDQSGVPIIGIVENMAGYLCPHCGVASDPFGHGGAEAVANAMGHAFLGRIPLDLSIRQASDAGTPPAAGDGTDAEPFNAIAVRVKAWLDRR